MHRRVIGPSVSLLITVAYALLYPASARAAQSFVYVVAPVCSAEAPCSPAVLIYDAATTALVTRISLPLGTVQRGLAISPDGRRLYVSNATKDGLGISLTVIDASRHELIAHYPISAAGPIAVSRDGSRVFIRSFTSSFPPAVSLAIFDANVAAIIGSIPLTVGGAAALVASPTADRLYVTAKSDPFITAIDAYDTTSGAQIGQFAVSVLTWSHLHVSRDGLRLYATAESNSLHPSNGGRVAIYDPSTLQKINEFFPLFPYGTVDAPGRNRVYVWDGLRIYAFTYDTLQQTGRIDVPVVVSMAITSDESHAWIATRAVNVVNPLGSDALRVLDLSSDTIVATIPLAGQPSGIVATPPNAMSCSYRLNTYQSGWTVQGGVATIALTTPCAWEASSSADWARLSASSGMGSQTLILTVDPNYTTTTNRTATLTIGGQLVTVTQASFFATPPFGSFDTPLDNATGVEGSLAVTGWALDDVGVTRVRVYRGAVTGEPADAEIYVGDATFVEGARPDVQAVFPGLPNSARAGWGLSVLTNMLPGGGNGMYQLIVYADDVEGHTALLGTRTFAAANSTSVRPFGTIDTPGQGQTVSGVILNFGWALTPLPNFILADGSTIDVLVDNVLVGHPVYNQYRPDIAGLFPGYPNTNGAVGYFVLDTTAYPNGVHTIAWIVRDSGGSAVGIGSRYFTIDNP